MSSELRMPTRAAGALGSGWAMAERELRAGWPSADRKVHGKQRMTTAPGRGLAPAMSYAAAPDRYDLIRYRRCGRSGLKLPEVSPGFWQNSGSDRPLDLQRATVM